MPLVNIYLAKGKTPEYIKNLCDGLHQALVETWNIPKDDRFHLVHEMPQSHVSIDKKMWGVDRSDDVIVFHITTSPRETAMKLALYQQLPEVLNEKIGLRKEDVFISIISNTREDWSFGMGKAQLLDN